MQYTQVDRERFWRHVKVAETGCMEWTGKQDRQGYGEFTTSSGGVKRFVRAHRFSWAIDNGPPPAHMLVCHKCDNPSCVSPYHLFLGNKADNVRDMYNKKRGYGQKLLPRDVQEIKDLYAAGMPQRALAKAYGVTTPHISKIVRGEKWGAMNAGA